MVSSVRDRTRCCRLRKAAFAAPIGRIKSSSRASVEAAPTNYLFVQVECKQLDYAATSDASIHSLANSFAHVCSINGSLLWSIARPRPKAPSGRQLCTIDCNIERQTPGRYGPCGDRGVAQDVAPLSSM